MSEEASWNPVSGCFQCPININQDHAWASINSLPCFSDIGRASYSVPLDALYVPLRFSESDHLGSGRAYPGDSGSGIGEIDNAQVGKYFAIQGHERAHIQMRRFPVKGLIHLGAGRAHQAVFNIISESNNRAWEDLQQWNSVIMTVTESIALVEELTATLLGCAEFRKLKPELQHQVESDRIEQEFVRNHSKLFGPDFEKIYRQLDKIYREFGIAPIKTLIEYSMDWLEVESCGKGVGIRIPPNRETSRSRLYKCLEIINSIRRLPEVHQWAQDDWDQFFDRWLLDFRRWRAGRQELNRFLGNDLGLRQEWWNDRGFENSDNPAFAIEWTHRVRKEIISHTVNSLYCDGLQRLYPDTQSQQIVRQLNERVRIASDHNRTVVVLGAEPNSIAIVFVPLFNDDNQEAIPFACLMTGEHQPPENRLIYDLAARKFLSTLLFYEGIRQIIATGCGVRCPVRSVEWAERAFARIEGNKLPICCGRNKELIALWEAGDKAKKLGLFKPHKWDRPHECM